MVLVSIVNMVQGRLVFVSWLLSVLSFTVQGEGPLTGLPCEYHGALLRAQDGKIVRFTSADMKRRATRKVELGGILRQADIKGTAVVDVLVGTSGEVLCLKSAPAHPFIRVEVEKALRAWTFKPAKVDGKPVAYLGRLQFNLCNILCGEEGPSMTLLK